MRLAGPTQDAPGAEVTTQLAAGSMRCQQAGRLFAQGRMREAEALLLDELRIRPDSVDAYRLLTEVERRLGNLRREAVVLRAWLALDACNPRLWVRFGEVEGALGRWDSAEAAYLNATGHAPELAECWQGLALAHLGAQRADAAGGVRDRLLRQFPDSAGTHVIDGHLLKAAGRTSAAIDAYRRAIALDPTSCSAIYNLVDVQPSGIDDPLCVHIQALLLRDGLDIADRANLEFAVARIFDHADVWETAFDHYQRANILAREALARRGIVYDPAAAEPAAMERMLRYGNARSAGNRPVAAMGTTPIFITGLPRSGTTLVERILGRHSRVAEGGELTLARECEAMFVRRRKAMGMDDPVDPARPADAALLDEARDHYLAGLAGRGLGAAYVTDKLPANFEIVGFLRLLFPQAPILHVGRHPMATCWSLFTANFGPHLPYHHSITHLAHYVGLHARLVRHWRDTVQPGMVEVSYEALVTSPEPQIRRLLDAVGLDWDAACMAPEQGAPPVLTASHGQVRVPVNTASVGRWKHYARWLQPLAELLGEDAGAASSVGKTVSQ